MYYIKKVYPKSCVVVDTKDGVAERLSNEYILECINNGIEIRGYHHEYGFYEVVPVSKNKAYYLGSFHRSATWDAYVVPTQTRANYDVYTLKVIRRKNPTWCSSDELVTETGVFKGITIDGKFIININGYDEELNAFLLWGLSISREYLVNSKEFCDMHKHFYYEAHDLYVQDVDKVDATQKFTSSEFLKLCEQDLFNNNIIYYITDLQVAFDRNILVSAADKMLDAVTDHSGAVSIDRVSSTDTNWVLWYEAIRLFLSFILRCNKCIRPRCYDKHFYLCMNPAYSHKITHLSIVGNRPLLHFISNGSPVKHSVDLINALEDSDWKSKFMDISIDRKGWASVDTLIGRYYIQIELLKQEFGRVVTEDTKKLALRSMLSGRGSCTVTGDGTLLNCNENKRHCISVPEGTKVMGANSVVFTDLTNRLVVPASVKEISYEFPTSPSGNVRVPVDALKIVFKSSSVSAFKTLLSVIINDRFFSPFNTRYSSIPYFSRSELLTINNFCLSESNIDTVLFGLLDSSKSVAHVLTNWENPDDLDKIPVDKFSNAVFKAVSRYCKTSIVNKGDYSVPLSTLRNALHLSKLGKALPPALPHSVNCIKEEHSPIKTEYYRYITCKQFVERVDDYLSGTVKYAVHDLLDKLAVLFDNYILNYKQHLIDLGFYDSSGDLKLINVQRYVKDNS